MTGSANPAPRGVYQYYWSKLQASAFVGRYLDGPDGCFRSYLTKPEEHAAELIGAISATHPNSVFPLTKIMALDIFERSLGGLMEKYRGHVVHSINVFLFGLCLAEEFPWLRDALLFYPSECVQKGATPQPISRRQEVFHFRWFLAAFFHDIGYPLELIAKALLPDALPVPWGGLETLKDAVDRAAKGGQDAIHSHVRSLRTLPRLRRIRGYDKGGAPYFAEGKGRRVPHCNDLIVLFAQHIAESAGARADRRAIRRDLEETFLRCCRVGEELSFDHGKLGSLLLMHEVRACYADKRSAGAGALPPDISWHRANVYHEALDAATAIYLHNTLRFELADRWGPFGPYNIPPLAYLLLLSDLVVEWDKPKIGRVAGASPVGESVRIKVRGRTLEIDYGTAGVGQAVCDKTGTLLDGDLLEVRAT